MVGTMKALEKKIWDMGVLPVIKLENTQLAGKLAQALAKGNLSAAEVTFRTDGADEVIRTMLNHYPDMLVGAGTVLNINQVDKALDAGAKFIVSPGFDDELVDYCIDREGTVFPGCVTSSEVLKAIKRKLSIVKFFPAKQFGGLEMIKALSGPFPGIKFMPTGGINLDNLESFLLNKNVFACGGTYMVADKLIKEENWDTITKLCDETVNIVRKVRKIRCQE